MKKKKLLYITSVLLIFLVGGVTLFLCLKPSVKEESSHQKQEEQNKKEDKTNTTENDKESNIDNPSENKPNPSLDTETSSNPNITVKPNESQDKPKPTTPVKPTEEEKPAIKPEEPNEKEESTTPSKNPSEEPEGEEKEETPTQPQPEVPKEEDKNDTLRKNIQKTYGVKIKYGDEIGDYHPKGVTPVKLTDETEIATYLTKINGELGKYPKGFFEDFNKKGMPLTIYFIKSANGSFAGFTDYQFMNDIKLTMTTSYEFEYTLHHELMHYIDCYLNITMYPKTPYEDYEKLNPEGFTYGNATSNQIYHMVSNKKNAYFISNYGATMVQEDRAEVFKYIMTRAYVPQGMFTDNPVLLQKARLISNQIKTYFPSVSGIAHWDRFIS